MEEQPDGKDAASDGRFAFWAALRLGSHSPSPGQSRTKKVLLFNRYATEQNSFCCSFLASPGPRLRAAGPPAVLRRGPCAPPGCLPRLRAPAGCFSGRGSRPVRRPSGALAGPRRIRGAPRGASGPAAGRGPSTVRPYGAAC